MKYTSRGQIKVHDQQLVNEISQNVFMAAKSRKSFIWTFIYNLIFFFVGVGAYISRCFLRKNIGERTTGIFTVLLIYPLLWLVFALYNIVPAYIAKKEFQDFVNDYGLYEGETYNQIYLFFSAMLNPDIEGITMYYFLREADNQVLWALPNNLKALWLLIVGLSLTYAINIYKRNKKNSELHSLYRGDSLLFEHLEGKRFFGVEINSTAIWIILEPIFIFLLSYVIQFGFGWTITAIVFRISAICLCFEECRIYLENRNLILDLRDSNIDANYIADIQSQNELVPKDNHSGNFHGRATIN